MKRISLFGICLFTVLFCAAQPTAGLVGYWPLDGNYTDLGPYAIHGTNTAATVTSNRFSQANRAMAFVNPGGSTPVYQYGSLPINSNLNFSGTQDFTISLWAFINTTYYHGGGLYDNNLNYGGPGVWWWAGSGYPSIQFNYKNISLGTPNGALTLGLWQQIICVRQTGTLKVYINGVLEASRAEGTLVPTFPQGAKIGAMGYTAYTPPVYNGHNGKIDEVRIYNRALSEVEISNLAVLPIRLNSFTAQRNKEDVFLRWQTAQEQNCDRFDIQRSIDGVNFNTIGTLKAAGNSSIPVNYQLNDYRVKQQTGCTQVFYRLESIDLDLRKAYSAVVPVKLDADQSGLVILGNPVKNELRIQFTSLSRQPASLMITDGMGKSLLVQQIQTEIGTVSTSIPVGQLPAGQYFISLQYGNDRTVKPFIKQ